MTDLPQAIRKLTPFCDSDAAGGYELGYHHGHRDAREAAARLAEGAGGEVTEVAMYVVEQSRGADDWRTANAFDTRPEAETYKRDAEAGRWWPGELRIVEVLTKEYRTVIEGPRVKP